MEATHGDHHRDEHAGGAPGTGHGSLLQDGDLPPGQHFIDGAFRPGRSGTSIDVVDPSSERTIAQVAEGTVEDTDAAVAAAYAAKDAWGRLTPKERSEVLHRVADRVAENADLLARLESANTGKPSAVAQDDVAQTIDTFRFMAGALRAPTSAAAGTYAEDHLSVILREPLGVIGVVTPWNYPLLMAAWKMAPILAAGNTLVIKPSEQTPLTTLKFAELVADILPAGVLNVVTGYGPVVGARLAEHPDIDMIALTGSVRSGKAVARAAAESLKRVHLELGGKAPVVIFPDADLAAAATALRAAGYWNSGQECGAALPRAGPRVGGRRVRRAARRRGRHDGRRRARRRRRRRDRAADVEGPLRPGHRLPGAGRGGGTARRHRRRGAGRATATSSPRRCWSTCRTARRPPARRSSARSSRSRPSPRRTRR